MFRSSASFDRLLERATSNLLLEPDWDAVLNICDTIRYLPVLERAQKFGASGSRFRPRPFQNLKFEAKPCVMAKLIAIFVIEPNGASSGSWLMYCRPSHKPGPSPVPALSIFGCIKELEGAQIF